MTAPHSQGSSSNSISRRDFLHLAAKFGAALGLGTGLGGVLAGCGGSEAPTASQAALTSTSVSAPTPATSPVSVTATRLPVGSISFGSARRYRVKYSATVHNTGFALDRLVVCQPCPIEWDGQKKVAVEEISPPPAKKELDRVFGNGIYYWEIQEAPKQGASLSFTLRFTFTAFETSTKVSPSNVRPYNQSDSLYGLYTRSEEYIESADPKIVAMADQVAAGETNPYRLARRFYDHVIATAHYKLLGKGLLGAKALATTGQGECGDYASLFIALARAKGVPARPVVGYWALSGIDQTHVWAEFYLEGLGWIPVDPTFGQSRPGARGRPDYYFGSMDNKRVILNKGFNVPLDAPAPDGYLAPFLQVPSWWFWGSGGDENSVSIARTSWKVTPIT